MPKKKKKSIPKTVKLWQNTNLLSVRYHKTVILSQLNDAHPNAKGKETVPEQFPTPTSREMKTGPKEISIS